MFKQLLTLIGLGGPEYDAKVLTRDSKAMVEMIHGQHGAESLREISKEARTRIDELTELNRAARSRRDNIAWSGITLAIIYIKAEMMEDLGLPAKNVIEGFMQQWSHSSE